MKEILLTSSVLILALLLLRLLFRKTISRRVQYALWGLVALRLLVPVSLPAMEHNVLTAAEPVTARITAPALYVTPYRETIVSAPPGVFQTPAPYQAFRVDTATEDSTVTFTDGKNVTHSIEYKSQIPLTPVLKAVWHTGMTIMAVWFLLANLRFMLRLRRSRRPYPVENCPYPVYLTAELPSPCLFGLFHPTVYLTPAAVESPETLRHVLIHETTHARHLDPLWSLLRCVCLAVYWFDPLVWIAAIVIFGVVEAATVGLVSIWCVIGSAAGLIAAVLDAPIWLQVVAFFIVSIAALIATRPLVRKLGSKGGTATNADRVLGGTARVTETIDNTIPSGEVYIDGKTWTARSESGAVIAPETLVKVIRLEGVKLYVDVPHNV